MSSGRKRSHPGTAENVEKKKPAAGGHWSAGLYAALDDKSLHVYSDEDMVAIKDKYPKAKYHYLVLPRRKIPNLKALGADDLPLLERMAETAKAICKDKDLKTFRYGYHAVPSMGLLHLHAISQDFDSECLKTKKHWNSFTTEYFVDSDRLLSMLKKQGCVEDFSNHTQLLNLDLKCHICKQKMKNMPSLKTHIKTCFKDKPAT